MKHKKKFALISVYDKKKLHTLCDALNKHNIGIISTGATSLHIRKLGFKCKSISALIKSPEILGGRVKTLQTKLHASILYNRANKSDILTFKKLDFPDINFVIVNLYPFQNIIKKNTDESKIIEMIDIGGVALLRAAAKNYKTITSISSILEYKKFIKNLKDNNGKTSINYRSDMAEKTFLTTTKYDQEISSWFANENKKVFNLKYGENPNQKAFYKKNEKHFSIFDAKIQGKELGYNNILDLDAGLNCIKEFNDPTCVIIKHNNPCGVGTSKSIYNGFIKAFEADPISAFGGIVVLNRTVDKKLAKKLIKKFFEIIAAYSFNKEALKILQNNKRLILIKTKNLKLSNEDEAKKVVGGTLVQNKNNLKIQLKNLICVSKKSENIKILNDLFFAIKVSKHVKSNAIVLVKNLQTVGIGAGQMSRIDSTKIAILKSKRNNKLKNFVAASDAFFPFTDNIKLLLENGCISIVQPKGSINDRKIVNFADKRGLSLYFYKYRIFKH